MNQPVISTISLKAKNPQKVKEAIALGKKLSKTPEITKVAVATEMFDIDITDEEYVAARRPAGARPGAPRTFLSGLKLKF